MGRDLLSVDRSEWNVDATPWADAGRVSLIEDGSTFAVSASSGAFSWPSGCGIAVGIG